MINEKDHISVCICTFKRPDLLFRLLEKLNVQITEGLFSYDIVVVDNDQNQSARSSVERVRNMVNVSVNYHCEPEQNIALARNRAVENSHGEFIAFLDDDEFPIPHWLINLYKSIYKYDAAGVLGPVKPHFEDTPSNWILKGKLCERSSFTTGTVLSNPRYTRTGNVLLSKALFSDKRDYFNPEFGRTGGEDVDFFKRMILQGQKFVWNDEAVVYESVPPERTKRKYFLTRALLRGTINSKHPSMKGVLKSIIASILYTIALPFLLFIGHHVFMSYLIKDFDHIGKLLGVCGFKVVKERDF